MKKVLAVLLSLTIAMGAVGCGGASDALDNAASGVASFIKGDVTGEVGKNYSTEWFEFSINTLETATEYKGVEVEEGYQFVIANITEKNIWDGNEAIPMGAYDFYMTADGATEEIWMEYSWDDAMMPDEFELQPDETATYDAVFYIPVDTAEAKFVYIEIDENEKVGATFTIVHTFE